MDGIGGQTGNNRECLRQLHKGKMLRLELTIECFSFFSSSFEVYLKSSPKIKRIWIGVLSFYDESQGDYIKSLFSFGMVMNPFFCLAFTLLDLFKCLLYLLAFVATLLFPYIVGILSLNIKEYFPIIYGKTESLDVIV